MKTRPELKDVEEVIVGLQRMNRHYPSLVLLAAVQQLTAQRDRLMVLQAQIDAMTPRPLGDLLPTDKVE